VTAALPIPDAAPVRRINRGQRVIESPTDL
jgi:hypothetical protein